MMEFSIRNGKIEDIPLISKLYPDNRKSKNPEVLKWLFTDPKDYTTINTFVATNKKQEIVGSISYVLSKYQFNEKIFTGVIPMSWIVGDQASGFTGIQLFKKVVALGDFAETIGGSQDAIQVYPVFKFEYKFDCYLYYKILNPFGYIRTLNKTFPKKIANVLALLFTRRFFSNKKVLKNIKIEETEDFSGTIKAYKSPDNVLVKLVDESYIRWLLNCPILKSKFFSIKDTETSKSLGYAVCFINTYPNGIKRGRIVCISHLGWDSVLWNSALIALEKYFVREKCCSISIFGQNKITKSVLKSRGYSALNRHKYFVAFKDKKGILEDIDLDSFHIQHTEGDKAYRDV